MVPEIQMPQDGLVFIESALFEVMADKLLGAKGRDALQSELLEHPESGKSIEETNGARKIRVALDGRGKSGGGRVIYYYRHAKGAIFFLAIYPKNEKENLSKADKKALRDQIKKINEEAYP
jgi:hypothetical protein